MEDSPPSSAARVAVIYAVAAALWIALTDQLVGLLVPDPGLRIILSTIKGWGFVATTAIILFVTLRGEFARRARVLQSLRQYQALAESSHDIMLFVQETSGRIVEANRAALQAYGMSRAQLLQKCIADLQHADAPPPAGPGTFFESLHRRSDGCAFPVEISAQSLVVGRERLRLSVIRDISERKLAEAERAAALEALSYREAALRESEAKYRLLAENMADVVWTLDPNTLRFSYVSPSVERLRGYSPAEVLLQPADQVMTPASFAMVQDELAGLTQAFLAKEPLPAVQAREVEQTCRDGSTVWTESVVTLMQDEQGSLLILGVTRDISERKRILEDLQSSLEEKEILLREVHHRVKNNLQAIIALMEMRARQIEDPGQRRFLLELEGQARAMSLVYEQLYQSATLARVSMGPYLRQLVANVLETSGRAIQASIEAPVELDVAQAMPCGLIVNELLTNMLKHAFPPGFVGPPALAIEMRPDGAAYRLSVTDNGVGMPAAFDPLHGPSLGLRLVNLWATHQLGGTLAISGGPGAAFTVTFGPDGKGLSYGR